MENINTKIKLNYKNMILSKNQAKSLNMNKTIDLKYMVAREYCDSVELSTIKDKATNYGYIVLHYLGMFALAFIISFAIFFMFYAKSSAYDENKRFLDRFPLETTRIGCYNDITKETREIPSEKAYEQKTGCPLKGDHNILLPAQEQIKVWLKYYNQEQIINRLALVNFESRFDENASNDSARGYVQTLRSHNIAIDIDNQLKWMSNREKVYSGEYFYGKNGKMAGCGIYWNKDNKRDGFEAGEYGVLACIYRYHYEANTGSWYGQRGVKVTKFYKEYMFGIK